MGWHLNFFVELAKAAEKKMMMVEEKIASTEMLVYKAEERVSEVEWELQRMKGFVDSIIKKVITLDRKVK